MKSLLAFMIGAVATADLGTSALLEKVNPGDIQSVETSTLSKPNIDVKDLNPISKTLYLELQRTDTPFEVRHWIQKILNKDFVSAAHSWSQIQKVVSPRQLQVVRAGYVYALSQINVTQTFFDEWFSAISDSNFQSSHAGHDLEQTLIQGFDTWLVKNAPHISNQQKKILQTWKLDFGNARSLMAAEGLQRSGISAMPALKNIELKHPRAMRLAHTILLSHLKKGDLKAVGKFMKEMVEPILGAQPNGNDISEHYLSVARILYQVGAFEESLSFYEKVPRGSQAFLSAQEEMTWLFLRLGKVDRLRGHLKDLEAPIYAKEFSPEIEVLRGISNLKLCFFDKTAEAMNSFSTKYKTLASQISKETKSNQPSKPLRPDNFSLEAEQRLEKLQSEKERLAALSEESIQAVVPAIGPQSHWKIAEKNISTHIERAKTELDSEWRRQWAFQAKSLREAIRKMHFVKIELLSQLKDVQMNASGDMPKQSPLTTAPVTASNDELVFPFDGTVWSDEVFQLRSNARMMEKCWASYEAGEANAIQ